MPARPARTRRQATPEPEPEVQEPELNGQPDLSVYLEKNLTFTQQDFIEWFTAEVADPADVDPGRLLAIGPTVYTAFQKSDFNKERKAERRAEREAAAAAEPEAAELEAEEAAPAKPARRTAGKPAAKPAAAANDGKPAPARGRRGAAAPY